MNHTKLFFATSFLALMLFSSLAMAGPGHDHGDAAPTPASNSTSPRFEAHSEIFEVVGIVNGGHLSIFVDRYSDNAPVLKAKVELESGSTKAVGQFHAEHGDYGFEAGPFSKPGTYPISLTVSAGEDIDILAGNLVVPDESGTHSNNETFPTRNLGIWALGLGGLIAAIFIGKKLLKRCPGKGLK